LARSHPKHENVGIAGPFFVAGLFFVSVFDYDGGMDSGEFGSADIEQAVALLRAAAQAMRSVTCSPTDEVRAIHAAVNALQAREADLLAVIDETKAHEAEGAASVATWAARELRQDPGTTRQMVRASETMRELSSVGAAARAGTVSLDHLHGCTFGLKHVGHAEVTAIESEVLEVTVDRAPRDLFTLMRYAKAIVHSDELDEAWLRGMDIEDFRVLRVGDGYQPSGFLGIDLGAKLKVFLDSVSVPADSDDNRTNAQRRIDGLDELLTKVLGAGLPADSGIKPHVSVIVDAETLKDALNGTTASQRVLIEGEPAILEGFGPIGPALLAYIAYGGSLTPILVAEFKENRKALDAGRSRRIATTKQRQIIGWRQKGRCANRGCHHPIGEVHHVVDWLFGGKTNLNNLAGLCRKCHALITIGKLVMTGTWDTGYTFTTSRAGPLARTG
jgi:hypothetical protein